MKLVIQKEACNINTGVDDFIPLDDKLNQTEILQKIIKYIRIIEPNEGLVVCNRINSYWVSIHTKEKAKEMMQKEKGGSNETGN